MSAVLDKMLARLPLPRPLARYATTRLNKYRKDRSLNLGANCRTGLGNAMFVIEAWLEKAPAIPMTLTLIPWDKSIDGLFQQSFTLHPGYTRVVIPAAQMARSIPLEKGFSIHIEPVGDRASEPVVFGIIDFITAEGTVSPVSAAPTPPAKPAAAKTAKCVVWDLDDTVWSGTLAEDGIEGVKLNPEAAEAIKMLDARGILNSVASKNDPEPARAALAHFGLAGYMLFPQIGWGPKSDSLRRIAQSIDIGIDTFVFVDDQPFERAEVSAAHPAVAIMTPNDIVNFSAHPLFDVPVTEESRKRRSLYRDEERRQSAAAEAGTDYIGFLRSCDIKLEISSVHPSTLDRIYELTQRTNQLNVTGARFTRDEVARIASGAGGRAGYVLRCADAFGDYGIIGFCVLNEAAGEIDAFFMSCRVQRKRVEHAFFAWLGAMLKDKGAKYLRVKYRRTAKNQASLRLFEELGFVLQLVGESEGVFERPLAAQWSDFDIVKVEAAAAESSRVEEVS
ncbi:MAG: HAD-IIIC family phosphatase [Rhodomicrobium sp.]